MHAVGGKGAQATTALVRTPSCRPLTPPLSRACLLLDSPLVLDTELRALHCPLEGPSPEFPAWPYHLRVMGSLDALTVSLAALKLICLVLFPTLFSPPSPP